MSEGLADLVLGCLPAEAASAGLLEVRVGPFWTVVHTTLGCGMASSMARESDPHQRPPISWAGALGSRSPLELTGLLRSSSPAEAAVGLATVNALLPEPAGVVEGQNAEAILGERGARCRVAVIGRFPFVERLRPRCRELMVFERRARGEVGDLDESDIEQLLPTADVVAVTATTLLNGTLEGILEHLRPDAFSILLGPSTPLVPALLELGFEVLCGSRVVDPGAVLRAASEGAVTAQIPAVRRVALWRGDHSSSSSSSSRSGSASSSGSSSPSSGGSGISSRSGSASRGSDLRAGSDARSNR